MSTRSQLTNKPKIAHSPKQLHEKNGYKAVPVFGFDSSIQVPPVLFTELTYQIFCSSELHICKCMGSNFTYIQSMRSKTSS